MALTFTLNVDGDLLTVNTQGFDENLEEAVAYGQSVIKGCVDNQCKYILVNESEMTAVLDKVSQYEMVQNLVSLVPHDLSIAFVVNEANFEDTSFGVLVAENRGMSIEIFHHEGEARKWLQQQNLPST
jgi:hypothetical protein